MTDERVVIDEPPPFLGTWPRVYAAIVIYLVVLISLFAWFTRAFQP